MKKNQKVISLLMIFLSSGHLILSFYYIQLYAYFNTNGDPHLFVIGIQILRLLFYVFILANGYRMLAKQQKRALAFYLSVFLFNLLLPFLFSL